MGIWHHENDFGNPRPAVPESESDRRRSRTIAQGACHRGIAREAFARHGGAIATEPEWMQGFGQLRRLSKETARVQSVIDEEFEEIEPEDRT